MAQKQFLIVIRKLFAQAETKSRTFQLTQPLAESEKWRLQNNASISLCNLRFSATQSNSNHGRGFLHTIVATRRINELRIDQNGVFVATSLFAQFGRVQFF